MTTSNWHNAVLPAASLAVHVTLVNTPTEKVVPDGGVHEIKDASLELSVTVGLFQDTSRVEALISTGQVILGGS